MRALVVYNNYSGRSNIPKKLEYICATLKTKYDIVECFKSTHPHSITEHIVSCGFFYDLILVVGGDGSVHEVINGIMRLRNRPTLAYIPAGTCNDAATTLGLRKNLKRTMRKILECKTSKIDVFKINEDYFIYGLAAGCLTEISYDASHKIKKNIGKFAYYIQGLKSYKDTKTINICIDTDQKKVKGDFSLFLALNTRYLAGFKIHRKRRIYLDDGNLRITLIKKTSKLMNIIDFGMFLLLGEVYKHNIIHFDASAFEVTSDMPVAYNTDGEHFAKTTEVHVEVVPRSIDVIIAKRVLRRHFINKN